MSGQKKFGRQRKRSYDELSAKLGTFERPETRDVFEGDNGSPVRSVLEQPQTMTSRAILAVIAGVGVALMVYLALWAVSTGLSSIMPHGGSSDSTVTVSEQGPAHDGAGAEWDVNSQGLKPLSTAPTDVSEEQLKTYYLEYQEASPEDGRAIPQYVDSEGNVYLEGDIPVLRQRVASREFMDERALEVERIKDLKAQSEYGILPLSVAPMNIDFNTFLDLYFADINPDRPSAIRHYYDYAGNTYEMEDIRRLWEQVQTGQLGSGEVSTMGVDGGYDSNGNSDFGGRNANAGSGAGGSGSGLGGAGGIGGTGLRLGRLRFVKWIFWTAFLSGLFTFLLLYEVLKRNLDAQNAETDVTDINQYRDDQHVQTPKEIMQKYDWFPDVGAHSSVMVSGMLSHVMLSKKGLKKVEVTRRADKDILDENGNVIYFKGEPLLDDNEDEITDVVPIIDEKFADALFTASGAPADKEVRILYDSTKIPYNPGNQNREKLKGYNTVADLINGDWDFPEYEVQRPAGAYIVDTEPVNTMVLAITRAGKGQTYIEPTIDMWTREKTPNNLVINDPKGELLIKFYVKGAVRGFSIVQFNLINSMKTDIYNRATRSAVKSCCAA